MSVLKVFLLGMMAAWIPCLAIFAWAIRDAPLAADNEGDLNQTESGPIGSNSSLSAHRRHDVSQGAPSGSPAAH
jgi:hypothetical protein